MRTVIIREKKIWELDSIFSKRKFFEMKDVFVCVFYILVCYFKICRLYEKDEQNFFNDQLHVIFSIFVKVDIGYSTERACD